MALADDILAGIDSGTLNDIAQQVGVEPDKLQGIIRDSLPALLGGMEHNVQSGEGAASLANALGQHADANPLGDMGALINGALGSGIIEKVLGGAAPNVSEAIGSKAGASGVDVEKILKIVAPIVMAYLAKTTHERRQGRPRGRAAGGPEREYRGQGPVAGPRVDPGLDPRQPLGQLLVLFLADQARLGHRALGEEAVDRLGDAPVARGVGRVAVALAGDQHA